MFLYLQIGENTQRFYIQNAGQFAKKKDNSPSFFIYKMHDTLPYAIFHNFLEVVIYRQKVFHFAIREVLYTKIQTLRKKQDNLCYVFILEKWTLCVTRFSIEFLKLTKGGVGGYYEKSNAFCVTFL